MLLTKLGRDSSSLCAGATIEISGGVAMALQSLSEFGSARTIDLEASGLPDEVVSLLNHVHDLSGRVCVVLVLSAIDYEFRWLLDDRLFDSFQICDSANSQRGVIEAKRVAA